MVSMDMRMVMRERIRVLPEYRLDQMKPLACSIPWRMKRRAHTVGSMYVHGLYGRMGGVGIGAGREIFRAVVHGTWHMAYGVLHMG